jgi:hypothetical protein
MSGEHGGGFSEPMSGSDSAGNDISVSFGEGSKAGETLIANGTNNLPDCQAANQRDCGFMQSPNHNHYGKGDGPNDNVKDRGQYTGPGS